MRKGFVEWLRECDGDLVLLQETRVLPEQISSHDIEQVGYRIHWHPAERKGYSGVAILTRLPESTYRIVDGLGQPEFDAEGRFLALLTGDIAYVSSYFPNSQAEGARLDYKLAFCDAVFRRLRDYESDGMGAVIGGDFNIAHSEIDLANPKQNVKNPGYLPEERAWMTRFLGEGFVDSFRLFEPGAGFYTWWSNRPGVRERNIGWRIDYHVVSDRIRTRVRSAGIHSDVMGSDHCPVSLVLE